MQRTWMKGALAALVLVMCAAGAFAQSQEDFTISQNADNTVTITGYKGTVKDVVIPATLYNRNVTGITGEAFTNMGLTSVVIPDTVTTIEGGERYEREYSMDSGNNSGAFSGNRLTKVILSKRLTRIEPFVFASNTTLTEITIPDSVTEIGNHAFSYCGLTRITWGKGIKTIGVNAFAGNKLVEFTIPAGVTIIPHRAFQNNQIKVLTIPNGVTSVGRDAFSDNPLEILTIPASLANGRIAVTEMAESSNTFLEGSFENCKPFCVTLPANMSERNVRAVDRDLANFYISQRKAAGVYIKNGPVWDKGTAAQANRLIKEREDAAKAVAAAAEAASAAIEKSGFTANVRQDGTLEITGYTARGKDVVIPAEIGGKAVTRIGASAFRRRVTAGDITSVVLPDSVAEIGNGAFANADENRRAGKSKLASVTWGTGLKTIENAAFALNSSLRTVESGTTNAQTRINVDNFDADFMEMWNSYGDRPKKYTKVPLMGWM